MFSKSRFKIWKSRREWDYNQPPSGFYCPFCSNIDPYRVPTDAKGTPRTLEADALCPAPRRPMIKDYTKRGAFLGKQEVTARQPTKWQYLEGQRLTFDIPYEDLLKGGQKGCPSCALLFDIGKRAEGSAFQRYFTVKENALFNGGDLETINGVDWDTPEDVMGIYVNISRQEADFTLHIKTFRNVDIEVFIMPDAPSPWPSIGRMITVPPDPGSAESLQAAKVWFKNCEDNHPKCSISRNFLPKRLLDVHYSDVTSDVKLVDTGELNIGSRYVALSHCWGKEQIITTTRDTEEDRRNRISFDELSNTFHDAVIMTRRLSVQYLWIDSLCIIQGDAEDWQEESAKMASVYEQACLVISASASSDGKGGCFSTRNTDDRRRCATFDGVMRNDVNFTIYARLTLSHTIQSINAQQDPRLPLFSRGWTYQERLLATRILHFAADELVWECKTGMACECRTVDSEVGFKPKYPETCSIEKALPAVIEAQSIFKAFKAARLRDRDNLLRNFRSTQQDAVDSDIWHMVIANFSRRVLTYDSDRLPALSGLAKVSALPSRGTYLAGHWSNTLINDLIWRNTRPHEAIHAGSYIAPSWSWAALTGCSPEFLPRPDILDSEILDARCINSGVDPTGSVSSGYLDIRGPLQRVTLFYQDSDFVPRQAYDPNRPKTMTRRFYASLDSVRDNTTYSVSSDLDICNYKPLLFGKPGLFRRTKMRTQRVLLDVSDAAFLDSSSLSYLHPSKPVYVLLIGRTKVVQWREGSYAVLQIIGNGWKILDNEEYLRALVLKESEKVKGAFERIGIIDPDPNEVNNPNPFFANDAKHPLTDHAGMFFKDANEALVRIV